MKQIILCTILGLSLLLVGCAKQTINIPILNNNSDQQATERPAVNQLNVNQNVNNQPTQDLAINWQIYKNDTFNYTVKYPTDYQVGSANPRRFNEGESFKAVGDEDGKKTAMFIEHLDSNFYLPSVGTNVATWVKDLFKDREVVSANSIGGVKTVVIKTRVNNQGQQDLDDYYFINGGQLYHIQILYPGLEQDQDMVSYFLSSFTFIN